jgi:hypothetical protein
MNSERGVSAGGDAGAQVVKQFSHLSCVHRQFGGIRSLDPIRWWQPETGRARCDGRYMSPRTHRALPNANQGPQCGRSQQSNLNKYNPRGYECKNESQVVGNTPGGEMSSDKMQSSPVQFRFSDQIRHSFFLLPFCVSNASCHGIPIELYQFTEIGKRKLFEMIRLA